MQATFNILNMHRVLHDVRDAVVSGNTFERIDGILAWGIW